MARLQCATYNTQQDNNISWQNSHLTLTLIYSTIKHVNTFIRVASVHVESVHNKGAADISTIPAPASL